MSISLKPRKRQPERTLDKVRAKARDLADDDRREAAAKEARKEARRRWEEVRASLQATADQLADAAEDKWDDARDAAAPRVSQLRKRAQEAIDSADLDRLRAEVGSITGDLRTSVVGLGADLRDASRAEADRIIDAIQETAAEAREEERKRRVRALVGWTAFGMVAGAVLALQFGPKQQDELTAEALPEERADAEEHEVDPASPAAPAT